MADDTDDALALVKEVLDELKTVKSRVEQLEAENHRLTKAVEDPQIMMQKQGWMKFVTPHADETFDPLNRNADIGGTGPFEGSGDVIAKANRSRFDELQEWEDAEREMRG